MQVPLYTLIKPLFYMVAIIVFWQTIKRRADSRWRFAAITGVLFAISVALSIYEATRPVDAVVNIAGRNLSYQAVKALLENVGLFAIVTLLLSLLTARLATAQREAQTLALVAGDSADAIVAFDMTGTITSWNLGAEMLFNYYADEVIGAKVTKIIAEDFLGEFQAAIDRCRKENFVRGVPARMLAKGHRPILAEGTLSPFSDDLGRPLGLSFFIRDVTERKKIEEELLQSSKMAAMGTMAAGIVHEFGNLLTVISGRTQLGKSAKTLDEARVAFDAVAACAARAKSITNNLLAYAERQKPHKMSGSVASAADAAVTLLQKELDRADIVVERSYGEAPETAFDHEQITQVFVNLIINALNAMRSGGGKITIQIGRKNDYVEAEIRDTGPGIPDDVMPGLFEPFSTVGGEADGKPRTGLGLFVCREIVKFHSGSITVESGHGKGTVFRVYLPVTSEIKAANTSDTRIVHGTECRVAVIDRDSMIRDLLAEACRRRGMHALAFQDSASANASDVAKAFDLVFVDVSIRDAGGVRFIERLKAEKGPFVVAMIGEAVDAEELRKIEEGTLQTLRKPFGLEQINAVCDMVFAPGGQSPTENAGKRAA